MNWIFETWKSVSTRTFVVKGFQQCGYIGWDEDEKLHSRLHDKILNRSVPIEEILEVNEMELKEGNSDVMGVLKKKSRKVQRITKAMMKR